MTPMQAIQSVFGNYANFNGRASRPEYWWFSVFVAIIQAALFVVFLSLPEVGMALLAIWSLAIILPALAVTVRRLHDTDRSGWWFLIQVIPFGGLVLLVFMVLSGTSGPNRYGPPQT